MNQRSEAHTQAAKQKSRRMEVGHALGLECKVANGDLPLATNDLKDLRKEGWAMINIHND